MIVEFFVVVDVLVGDDKVCVVILIGEGISFCVGGDLGWMCE